MRIHIITFYNHAFKYAAKLQRKSLDLIKYDTYNQFTLSDFRKTEFYNQNFFITNEKKGAGYWLWKPYYINKVLCSIDDGDVLVYIDSGARFINDISPLIDIASKRDDGIVLFENYQGSSYVSKLPHFDFNYENVYENINKITYWCKQEAFDFLNLNRLNFNTFHSIDASFQIYKKTNTSISFVSEWLSLCMNKSLLSDEPDILRDSKKDDYIFHLHDQSLLGVIAAKNQLELYRSPSQMGNHFKLPVYRQTNEFLLLPYSINPRKNSPFPTIVDHHRIKYTNSFVIRLRMYLAQEKRALFGI